MCSGTCAQLDVLDLSVSHAQVVKLPVGLGKLQNLHTLLLVDMYELTTLPASFKELKSLTTLSIQNCLKFARIPADIGPMPLLTKLELFGPCCMNLPPCVGMWPLRHLELSGYNDNENTVVLPWLLPSLASTLCFLSLDRGSMSHANVIEYMKTFPMMPKLFALRLRPSQRYESDSAPMRPPLANMPALQYLDGYHGVDSTMPGLLKKLKHLRVSLQGGLAVDLPPMTTLLRLEIVNNVSTSEDCANRFDNWLHSNTFPQLRELVISDFVGISHLPKSIATLTSLRELSIIDVTYWDSSFDVGMYINSDIMSMQSLHTLNIVKCDIASLPDFNLASLKCLRISSCSNLVELPHLHASGLPVIEDLQLNDLKHCCIIDETLGELTTLLGLYITNCPREQSTIPMSLQHLTNLCELVVSSCGDTSVGRKQSLLSDVATCLPSLRNLRKLCLVSTETTLANAERDTVAIGLALKAYPLPLLAIDDVTIPNLGVSNRHCMPFFCNKQGSSFMWIRNKWSLENNEHAKVPPAPYGFGKYWLALGLPPEAETWSDHHILVHWRTMQDKILAFACGGHSAMGSNSAFTDLSNNLMLTIADYVSGTDTFRTQQIQRTPVRATVLDNIQNTIISTWRERLEPDDEMDEEMQDNIRTIRCDIEHQRRELTRRQQDATIARENAAKAHAEAMKAAEAAHVAADIFAQQQISNTLIQTDAWEAERQRIRDQHMQAVRDRIALSEG